MILAGPAGRRVLRRPVLGMAALLLPLLAAAGCGDAIHNSQEDGRFIRTRTTGEMASDTVEVRKGPLLPLAAGGRWRYRFTVQPLSPLADGSPASPTVRDADVVCVSAATGSGAGSMRLETRPSGRAATGVAPLFAETYHSDASGVSLAAMGVGAHALTLTPAQPLFRTPLGEQTVTRWQGTVHAGGQTLPATGYSRVSYAEQIALPSGKVGAYRIDTIFLARTRSGQQVTYPMIRWFAPGVGIVQQRFLNGNAVVTQTLLRSSEAPGRPPA